ncbi:hypothetical protein G443_002520 [Actinoalloteichus cyanogriseus DSM 43889]|uniref:Pyrrolo-quinoline quinone repeat domain-containing protein n=1 Tax=Actinoalloteichus caeruleus DSM 43889 TaxID=1120930 RepID=A0ABT1JIB5_ACTCY|nr:hypothetical protein [Actinoalloteichus caeruleus DSM 43889]
MPGAEGRDVVKPERRTRGDVVVASLLMVGVLAVGAVLWRTSDLAGTTAEPSVLPVVAPDPAVALPAGLQELWRADSPATSSPVVAGPAVATASGGEVVGRDALTGEPRWRYARDLELCTVSAAWERAVAVYRRGDFCSEVTTLDGATGDRAGQRHGDSEPATELVTDGRYVATTGERFVEIFGSNMVMTLEYGDVPAVVNPNRQPRSDCRYLSTLLAEGRLALIERCPTDVTDRVTLLTAKPDDSDRPEETYSQTLDDVGARLVALTDDHLALWLPNPSRIVVYDTERGDRLAEHPVDTTAEDLDRASSQVPETTASPSHVYWYTGRSTVALSLSDLSPSWSVPDTLGSGAVLAGRLLVPEPGGHAVVDTVTGERVATLPVDRGGHAGPVRTSVLGPVLLEQRASEVVALG